MFSCLAYGMGRIVELWSFSAHHCQARLVAHDHGRVSQKCILLISREPAYQYTSIRVCGSPMRGHGAWEFFVPLPFDVIEEQIEEKKMKRIFSSEPPK